LLETNSDYLWRAPNAFGLLWKNEDTRALTSEENRSEDPAKPRISNRQLSVNYGTLLGSHSFDGLKRA
jgi:hypothetical protein